ncbi:flagellar filament capping protein FliD [uncultured Clostridium sp.]|uniref:flagellar filament capping protein FliD n=1 Tax=uncultured Clostridium sp. TaxID=59620 RepID=UPI0025CBDA79|nr:flagellar filament capping protein FliD [uncultured Clostridium sp.]
MMTAVSKEANVTFTHSNLTDKFVMVSKDTGSASEVKMEGDLMTAIFGIDNIRDQGTDAEVEVKSPYGSNTITSASNKITFDGITIDINKSVDKNATVSEAFEVNFKVESDVENTFNNIKELVDEYNKMIDTVYGRITEKKQYSYTPLTDEEKEEMTEKEIELWEKKCKQGILKNDTYLTKLTSSLREAFSMPVEGSTISLSEIGISFDADYTAGPKLTIDEDKLKKALEERGDEVEQLFIKTDKEYSTYDPNMSSAGRKQRFNNSGIFQRVSDVLNDAYRTTRDSSGRKGYLLEVAGLEGDTNNTLYKNIQTLQDKLSDLQDKYNDAEDRYYSQFASLETAMNNLNSQQLWLSQQLGLS